MVSGLHRQIDRAARAGIELDEIEELIIAPAPVDEEMRPALWLYAEALDGRREESMLGDGELAHG